jgi:hypothetical protein
MSQIFESPVFGYPGQPWNQVDIYSTMFNSAEPEVMGESKYLNARDAGISFALNKKLKIESIFLYADGVEDFKQYVEELPGGISFDMSRSQVRKALGEPSFSAEVGGIGLMAIDFSFDRYESDTHYIRFEYTENNAHIRLVTIGKA